VDLTADAVLFVVDLPLFRFGDMAIVTGRVDALLMPNALVLGMQLVRLTPGELMVFQAGIDAAVLVAQTRVHFDAPRMMPLPIGFREARAPAHKGAGEQTRTNNRNHFRIHPIPPSLFAFGNLGNLDVGMGAFRLPAAAAIRDYRGLKFDTR
jgi:hypothetical protein